MDEREIYAKTDAGREEMRTRALQLSGALRTVLLLVDGIRPVARLKELMAGGKAPADALEQLLAAGLITLQQAAPPVASSPEPEQRAAAPTERARVSPSAKSATRTPEAVDLQPAPGAADGAVGVAPDGANRFNVLYAIMNEIVSDYLGLRGYFMQLKIEKCSSTEELLALQDELRAAISKAHSPDVATELINRIQASA